MSERREFLKQVGAGAGAIGILFGKKAAANAEEVVREAAEGAKKIGDINVKIKDVPEDLSKTLAQEIRKELKKGTVRIKDKDDKTVDQQGRLALSCR